MARMTEPDSAAAPADPAPPTDAAAAKVTGRFAELVAEHVIDRLRDRDLPLGQLATALACAQAKIQAAAKDRSNPHFGSKYATLASVWDACREPLTANGLSIVQLPRTLRDGEKIAVEVETVLFHKSGERISNKLILPVAQATAQGVGSALTYARRYALSSIVGVAPDDDDDGNAASGKPAEGNGARSEQRDQAPSGVDSLAALRGAIKRDFKAANRWQSVRELCTAAGVPATPLEKMPAADLRKLHDFLKAAIAEAATPTSGVDTPGSDTPSELDKGSGPPDREPGEDGDELGDGVPGSERDP